jgi:secreted PhoX family phosphatase
MDRRTFLQRGALATAAFTTMGSAFWQRAFAAPAEPGDGPYGPLQPADANGIMLPEGFTSRVIARAGVAVVGTAAAAPYLWHIFPDGGATFETGDGGWVYVSNSEVPNVALGGAGAIRFNDDGAIHSAYRILDGTRNNCAGGPTPWGTWLSCEETSNGLVYECDPLGVEAAVEHPALGSFQHEAAVVDPVLGHVYLTEDQSTGLFYRFTPADFPSTSPDLTAGTLEGMIVHTDGTVAWQAIPDPSGTTGGATRSQAPDAFVFSGGEGCWFDAPSRTVYFTTKGDNKVWALDVDAQALDVVHDPSAGGGILSGVDNCMVSRSGDLFVAEDGGSLDIVLITPDRVIAKMLTVTGQLHAASEIAGPAFSPDGSRLYFSSQRGAGVGITFEVSGPFRTSS